MGTLLIAEYALAPLFGALWERWALQNKVNPSGWTNNSINLVGCFPFGDEQCVEMCHILKLGALPDLESITLTSTVVGDQGALELAEMLDMGAAPRLTRIFYANTMVGSKGVAALSKAARNRGGLNTWKAVLLPGDSVRQ